MSRCVPNWDLHDEDTPAGGHPSLSFHGPDLPSVDSEVAELTWENGQLSLHGLGQPRLNFKPAATAGTLESLMNQATANQAVPISGRKHSFACAADLVPWFNPTQAPTDVVAAASGTMMMDALVPCAAAASDDPHRQAMWLLGDSAGHGTGACGCCSTRVGSCSAMGSGDRLLRLAEVEQQQGSRKRMRGHGGCGEWGDHQSANGSATFSHHVTTQDMYEYERELDNATSEGSPDKAQSGKVGKGRAADTTTDEHDSVYSRPEREDEVKRRIGKSLPSTRRSRAVAIHNQSERKRRDKINQKMKTLQKLVPNSSKTDKASVLDEVIDYLKQLQAQIQLMSRINMMALPQPMMLPLAMQQQLQMSMMAAPMLGLGLAGMHGIMAGDMSAALGVAGRPNIPGIPPVPAFLHPFMPMATWDENLGAQFAPTASGPPPVMPDPLSTFLASQSSQAMALDAYSRLAAIYQQQQQQQPQNPNN